MPTLTPESELSGWDRFLLLPRAEQERKIAALSEVEAEALAHDWEFWSRPSQRLPGNVNDRTEDGSWTFWFPMAGRGWGKTRTGAETVRQWVKTTRLVNLVGPTADDARDIMVEGESGILSICPKGERPTYRPSKRRLEWPNGARSLIFTADEPDRLRGKQHMKFWADEPASWRYPDAWDQLEFGLRLGANPQGIVTGTPRKTPIIKALLADPQTLITRGMTKDNAQNLSRRFLDRMMKKYDGTRLGRQELEAVLLEDNPNAVVQREWIEKNRVQSLPKGLVRICVAIDPSVTAGEDSDEVGIIVAGKDGRDPAHYYVFDDLSGVLRVEKWAERAVRAYTKHEANTIVGEVNNGGDLIEAVIRQVMIDGKRVGDSIAYAKVWASRGKEIRAEPVALAYEQGRVHHVGSFPQLEDELCDWDPTVDGPSPNRLDADVWAITDLMEGAGAINISDEAIGRF